MLLSIIIVNYKTPALVIGCLQSVYAHTTKIAFEVIVADNHSMDNSRQLILEKFPAVKWIQMDYNAGFARANNAGLRIAAGDVVLLLNSDTICDSPAIENCVLQFVSDVYVACGVQLKNPDGSPQISGNYFVRGGLNNLLSLPYTGAFVKWIARLFHVGKPHVPDATSTTEVDWINGAFLMVKKEVIAKAGLLDEDFFLYAEEAEWCSRIRKHGKCCIYGQFQIIHLQGETSTATFETKEKGYKLLHGRKGLQIMLSNFVRIRKQSGAGWYIIQMLLFTLEVPLYFVARLLTNIFLFRNIFDGYSTGAGFAKNVAQLWSYAGKILSGQPYFYKVI